MKGVGAAAVASTVAFAMVLLVVMFMLDEPTDPCAPITPGSGGAVLPPGSKAMPMAEGTYIISDTFGTRGGAHRGIDMAADDGTPIYAAADGVVAAAGPATGFGQWIVLDHNIGGQAYSTVYGHMWESGVLVGVGDTVRAGQQIATVGNNGDTTGAHLHFEVTQGLRLGGGTHIDPMPWLADAGNTSPDATVPDTSAPGPDPSLAATSDDLPALPAAKGSEEHLQVDAVRVARVVAQQFPEIQTIGGWRPTDTYDDHPSGRAVDIMIPNYTSGQGKALGDRIAEYLLANAEALRIEYIIWRQEYRPAVGEANTMEDRGGDTANHYDHVHVTVAGGGHPDGSTTFGPAPGAGPGSSPQCGPGVDDLAPGSVPEEYAPWYRKAGQLCPQISSSLLAAQGKQESGFNPNAVSSVGAEGIAQFMPYTWPSWGEDSDGNGRVSAFDPGDAIMAQGKFMCSIAADVDTWIAEGKVSAPNGPEELYLAAYNAGPGAVLSSGGFPSGHADYEVQTRPYAANILAMSRQFSKTLS